MLSMLFSDAAHYDAAAADFFSLFIDFDATPPFRFHATFRYFC